MPAFTLRGGTTEVLRGIVARGLLQPHAATTPRGQASDQRKAIAEAASGVLAAAPGSWKDVADLGFTGLTMPEELGGSGGDLRDAAVVVAEAARHCAPLPIAEANFLACPLLAAAGIELPDGILTGGAGTVIADQAGQLTGTVRDVPWLRDADYLVTLAKTETGPAVALLPVTAAGLSTQPESTWPGSTGTPQSSTASPRCALCGLRRNLLAAAANFATWRTPPNCWPRPRGRCR